MHRRKVVFFIGVFHESGFDKWKQVIRAYAFLSEGLRSCGFETLFYVNDKLNLRRLEKEKVVLSSESSLIDFLEGCRPDVACIWGGRTPEDQKLSLVLNDFDLKVVYSELGWFPQKGTIYFDRQGTNANASLVEEFLGYLPSRLDVKVFERVRKKCYRDAYGLPFWKKVPKFGIEKYMGGGEVLVPLQDEGDTNIILSSPFKKMSEFVKYLSQSYPNVRFKVRCHPKASYQDLPELDNVYYEAGGVSIYESIASCDAVMGINSTVLLQAVLLNKTVISFGRGLGTGGGVFIDQTIDSLLLSFDDINVKDAEAESFLTFLIARKQLLKSKLKSKKYLDKKGVIGIFS